MTVWATTPASPRREARGGRACAQDPLEKQLRKLTCHLTCPRPPEQGPETRRGGTWTLSPVEEAWLWVCPGRRARAQGGQGPLRPPLPALFPDGPLIAPTPRAVPSHQTRPHVSDADPPSSP